MCLLAACGGGGGSGPQDRTVRVDYSHDEFGSYFLEYFPREVTLRPGRHCSLQADLDRRAPQRDHGDHGRRPDEAGRTLHPGQQGRGRAAPRRGAAGGGRGQQAPALHVRRADRSGSPERGPALLPGLGGASNRPQHRHAPRPSSPNSTAARATTTAGSSPTKATGGNEFSVPLAGDIEPGTYFYYCNYHGPLMSGKIKVVGKAASIPSQDDVNKTARQEIERHGGSPSGADSTSSRKVRSRCPRTKPPPIATPVS